MITAALGSFSNSNEASHSDLLSEPQPIAGSGGTTFELVCGGNDGAGAQHQGDLCTTNKMLGLVSECMVLPPLPLPRSLLPSIAHHHCHHHPTYRYILAC